MKYSTFTQQRIAPFQLGNLSFSLIFFSHIELRSFISTSRLLRPHNTKYMYIANIYTETVSRVLFSSIREREKLISSTY